MKPHYLLHFFFWIAIVNVADAETFTIASQQTGDTYTIVVNLPTNYSPSTTYPTIYYLDANLKSGIAMRSIAPNLMNQGSIQQAVLIGVQHHGNYKVKRRRDFIQAHQRKQRSSPYHSNDANYGQSEKFYQFLKQELIPAIEKRYAVKKTRDTRTLCGHSFGGLFTIYSLIHQDQLFKNHLAISPSLWVNYQNIFVFEEQYWAASKAINANLYLCAGDFEVANLVRHNVMVFNTRLTQRNYRGLRFKNKIFPRKTHISIIQPAIRAGLLHLLKN